MGDKTGWNGPDGESPGRAPGDNPLRKTVTVPVVLLALLVVVAAGIGLAAGYLAAQSHSTPVKNLANDGHTSSAQPARPPVSLTPLPSASLSPFSTAGVKAIPLGAACRWAFPGQASGKTSGSAYSIVCLGVNGHSLGGFGGAHSLNAWCADPSHTDGVSLPEPDLVDGAWMCAASRGQSAPAQGTPSGPPPVTSGATPSQPGPAASSSPSPSSGSAVSVPIPLGAACRWAYPGQASGKTSGSAYSIVCLGVNGQVLGGFGGAHSLNAWCADPSHTDGKHAPNPSLIDGTWACTA